MRVPHLTLWGQHFFWKGVLGSESLTVGMVAVNRLVQRGTQWNEESNRAVEPLVKLVHF